MTGVSRSGRVRKKSSKLVDFESPDDITETKAKRQKAQLLQAQQLQAQQILERFEQQHQQQQITQPSQPSASPSQNASRKSGASNSDSPTKLKQETASDEMESSVSESDDGAGVIEDERYSMDDTGTEDDVDPLMIDERETGFKRLEPPEQEMPSQAQSLYMLEKCKKKLIIKDGKIIGRMKAQRKDKGVKYSFLEIGFKSIHCVKMVVFVFRGRDLLRTCCGRKTFDRTCWKNIHTWVHIYQA